MAPQTIGIGEINYSVLITSFSIEPMSWMAPWTTGLGEINCYVLITSF